MQDIIVFGKGWYFEQKRGEMGKKYRIIAFLDNAAEKIENKNDENIPVYFPKDVKKLPQVPIVIMSIHFVEMWQQLISYGVDEKRIDFGINYTPFFDCTEEILNKLEGAVKSHGGNLMVLCNGGKYTFSHIDEYRKIMNGITKDYLSLDAILSLPLSPYSRRFGRDRGTPVDRYYIDEFLKTNSTMIRGDVMEIGDAFYTKQYGQNIDRSYVLHAMGLGENAIKGDLTTGEGIRDEFLDCFICTQTIQVIYDIDSTVRNIYRSLRDEGVVLATMHGISQLSVSDYNRWGEYWRFTKKSVKLLFEKYFDEVIIASYGNVKTATALLYGLCMEDLSESDYMINDEYYPVIITVVGKKKKGSNCRLV